jgi:hypothetical protein
MEIAVSTTSNKTVEPRKSYTFEAIPEDEETQDELNRRLRKPGEPGYCAPPKRGEARNSQASAVQGEPPAESRKE